MEKKNILVLILFQFLTLFLKKEFTLSYCNNKNILFLSLFPILFPILCLILFRTQPDRKSAKFVGGEKNEEVQ